jgi:hypothetical protein
MHDPISAMTQFQVGPGTEAALTGEGLPADAGLQQEVGLAKAGPRVSSAEPIPRSTEPSPNPEAGTGPLSWRSP